jgi:hypothetical protein
MSAKKFISVILVSVAFCLVFNVAKAVTAEELLKEIARLQALIAQLQKQLAELQAKPVTWCHDFNVNLKIGDSGSEVEALQTALEKEGFDVSKDPKGYFGEYTASAVVGFQEKYKDEILSPWGLTHGTGFVGRTTRAKLNKLYGCEVVLQPACTDTDGGANIYVKGITKLGNETRIDYCVDENTVAEYWCSGMGGVPWIAGPDIIKCPSGCKDGACLKPEKFITVISPNGGERWIEGNTYEIRWKANGVEKVVIQVIDYNCSSESPLTIATNILASQGSYSWKIPANFFESQANVYCPAYAYNPTTHYGWRSGDNFKIFIAELKPDGSYGVRDESDNYFSIVSPTTPSITVVSPNGGEKWIIGNTYEIKCSCNIPTPHTAYILLYKGDNYYGQIGRIGTVGCVVGQTESYSWKAGYMEGVGVVEPGNNYKIRINLVDSTGILTGDFSDNYFSLVSAEGLVDGYNHYCFTLSDIKIGTTINFDYTSIDDPYLRYFMISVDCPEAQGKRWYTSSGCSNAGCSTGKYCNIGTGYSGRYSYTFGSALPGSHQICTWPSSDYKPGTTEIYKWKVEKSIIQPTITVIYPNGGERWTIGETRRISWNSVGINYVRIYIIDPSISGSGSTNYIYDGFIPASTGYYDWLIQRNQLPGYNLGFPRNYKIRIDGFNEAYIGAPVITQDLSDNYFTIVSP